MASRRDTHSRIKETYEEVTEGGTLIALLGVGVVAVAAIGAVAYTWNKYSDVAIPIAGGKITPKQIGESALLPAFLQNVEPAQVGESVFFPGAPLVEPESAGLSILFPGAPLLSTRGDNSDQIGREWYFAMGGDVYNPDGFLRRGEVDAIANNAYELGQKFGTLQDYFATLTTAQKTSLCYRGLDGNLSIDTFGIRQHLTELSFSDYLFGPGEKLNSHTARSLQEYIWTDYDRAPAWVASGDPQKIVKLRQMLEDDVGNLDGFINTGDENRAAVVRNRIWAISRILPPETRPGGITSIDYLIPDPNASVNLEALRKGEGEIQKFQVIPPFDDDPEGFLFDLRQKEVLSRQGRGEFPTGNPDIPWSDW